MNDQPILLLDTHFWIWGRAGDVRRVPPALIPVLNQAAAEGRLLVHPISAWEVATLVRKGRLTLDVPVEEWVRTGMQLPGVQTAVFTAAIATAAGKLDARGISDPADRILIATAQVEGVTLVTMDREIIRFAESGRVRVLSG
ncbi:MAG: type II toxin-antitoxin system VapC family toxin [Gemmatimonadota bacterium]|nr:type II toxin-antitoxin system VapC family toxin [Gemmatimonadota bacterium]